MRNHLGKPSAAQSLDGNGHLTGRLRVPDDQILVWRDQ
jgi:hypothetical protein